MTSPPHGESRPGEGRLSKKSLAGDTSRIQPIGDTSVATGRRYWARQLIERQTPDRPMYGSTAWLALSNDHPDKIAACVIAAECWASSADTLEQDLRREIEGLQLGLKRAEDAEYTRAFTEHRREMTAKYGRIVTSFEKRRADQLEAAKPRPGDYPGGPGVDWDRGDGA